MVSLKCALIYQKQIHFQNSEYLLSKTNHSLLDKKKLTKSFWRIIFKFNRLYLNLKTKLKENG